MYVKNISKIVTMGSAALSLTLMGGCGKQQKIDPFEPTNRAIYGFNKGLDRILIKPVARVYEAILPKPVQIMVGNFFANINEFPNIANDILQGNWPQARVDTARLIVNSTWGVVGLFDMAAKAPNNILARNTGQDFGITLAKWGYKESAYFVLPLFGPRTIRDSIGLGVNLLMTPTTYIKKDKVRIGLWTLNFIDIRASLLKAEPAISESVDEYTFIRDFYLQRREFLISGQAVTEATGTEQPKLEGPPE